MTESKVLGEEKERRRKTCQRRRRGLLVSSSMVKSSFMVSRGVTTMIFLFLFCFIAVAAPAPAPANHEDLSVSGEDQDDETDHTSSSNQIKTVIVDSSQDGSGVHVVEEDQQEKSARTSPVVMMYGNFELLESLPHDTAAFTQGLSFHNGHLYQGTGFYGSSSIQKLDPDNPSIVLQSYDLPSEYFGEGITYYTNGNGQDRILQLTWKERTAIVYNIMSKKTATTDTHTTTMTPLFRFQYHAATGNGEGWGITFNEQRNEFIVSDGSDQLFFWDTSLLDNCEKGGIHLADNQNDTTTTATSTESGAGATAAAEIALCDNLTMEPKRSIKVRVVLLDDNVNNYGSTSSDPIPVRYLNELELIRGDDMVIGTGKSFVLANVWFQNCLLEIDPDTGDVVKLYDLSRLCPQRYPRGENVLNGISVSGEGGRIVYVTGKQWPYLYKIKLL